uniref:BURP domain-containing protein n=1 Tax=Oryza meridionalis TaxID=40149 RepID=A0A0E0CY03_9ORYZ
MVAMILVMCIVAFASASDNDELPASFNILQQKPGKAAQTSNLQPSALPGQRMPPNGHGEAMECQPQNRNTEVDMAATLGARSRASMCVTAFLSIHYKEEDEATRMNGVKTSPICFANLLPSVAPPPNEASLVGGEVKGLSNEDAGGRVWQPSCAQPIRYPVASVCHKLGEVFAH